MKRFSNHLSVGAAILTLGLCLAFAPGIHAAESDLSTTTTAPASVQAGVTFTETIGYANAGPDTPASMYVFSYFLPPMGLDVVFDDDLNGDGAIFSAIQATADDTDTEGNFPLLFYDSSYCEDLVFQLQGSTSYDDQPPMQPLASGESGSFSYDVMIPMEAPRNNAITITEPASLAQSWFGNTTDVFDAAGKNKYGRGSCENDLTHPDDPMCEYIEDNCFGARISQMDEPLEAEFELVNDGSADPTFGCEALVDFTPGNIAILRRGGCQFGTKAFNADQAQAAGMVMVFDDNCNGLSTSDQCTFGMLGGDLGGLVTIPVASLAMADGEPIIAALEGSETVRVVFGDVTPYTAQSSPFANGTGDTDPDDTNDDSFFSSEVSLIPDTPVAAFTYAPAEPATGAAVQFTDASTGGAPDTWSWDFGDGGTSMDQNPSYTFSSAGTFTVSLTVTNGGGQSSTTQDVTVTLGTQMDQTYFIPAAALAAGAEGSFFQTDVDVNNSGATEANFAFQWLPRGVNNSSPTQSDGYTLAAGASIRFENVLEEVFGLVPPASGALAVVSNSADLKLQSRTYNLPTVKASGTFGQALPGIPASDLIMQNETKRIIFMSEDDDLRANVGCVNGTDANLPIKITLYDDEGAALETQTMSLAPWSNNQINKIFADYAPTNGYVDVTSIKAGAAYYCYGSVLDNGSNDPTSVLPTEYGSTNSYFIPAAALASGAEGSFFQTDVDINNAGAAMVTYQFLWLPRGTNNSDPQTSDSLTLAAGASVRYENVLEEVFGLVPPASGALAITSDSPDLGVMSRTYNVPTVKISGTFGQAIPGVSGSNLITQNETKRIIFMSENDDLRANLGCVNGVNDNLPITITLYDETGAMLGTESMSLSPWSNNQINRIFADYAPTNGYADVTSIKATAEYYCYGSVLDNGSNDPTTILPQ